MAPTCKAGVPGGHQVVAAGVEREYAAQGVRAAETGKETCRAKLRMPKKVAFGDCEEMVV